MPGASLPRNSRSRLFSLFAPFAGGLMLKLPLVAVALYLARLGRRRVELAAVMAVLAAASVLVSLPPPR